MRLARRVQNLKPSSTLAITAQAKRLKAQGMDVVNFGAGEPDFDTPENVKQAAIAAIQAGFTRYTPAGGIPELRQAVADRLRQEQGLEYSPQEILISCGAKHALFNLALALFEPGDEVILPAPYWVTYPEQITLAGATPVIVKTQEEDNFCLTPEALKANLSPRTKALILNSPNNPTGCIYPEETLSGLAELAIQHNLWVISDECYARIVYPEGRHISIASLGEEIKRRTLIVDAVSKTYSMTGWRIGYTAGPQEVIAAMENIQSQSTSNPTSISQKAALEALTGSQEHLGFWLEEFRRRRDYITEKLNCLPGLSCIKPKGAFYIFPNCSGVLGSSIDGQAIDSPATFCRLLLDKVQVAAVPGEAFGSHCHIRLSYACSREVIHKGIQRLAHFLEQLK